MEISNKSVVSLNFKEQTTQPTSAVAKLHDARQLERA
jgi:hypothetical protein